MVELKVKDIIERKKLLIKGLEENKKLASKLGAEIHSREGKSVSSEIIKFVEEMGITQIILGHSGRSTITRLFRGSTINKIIDSYNKK